MWRVLALVAVIVVPASALRAQPVSPEGGKPQIILVLPFEMPAGSTGMWIPRAAQQDLITDLAQATLFKVKAPVEPRPADDVDAAVKIGKEYKASIVIFGQAQVVDLTVRLTGQVVDVSTGQTLGALKVTGPLGDLFDLEDALTQETLVSLPRTMLKPQTLASLEPIGDQAPIFLLMEPSPFQNIAVPMIDAGPQPQKQLTYAPVSTLFSPIAYPYAPGFVPTYAPYAPFGLGYGGFGGFYPGFYSSPAWFGAISPFGWIPVGGVVVSNPVTGFPHHRDFRHHRDGDSGGRWNVPGGSGNVVSQAPAPQNFNTGTASIPVQFNWSGPAAVPAAGAMPSAGLAPTAIPRGGFAPMPLAGPRFNNFGAAPRGGTATGR